MGAIAQLGERQTEDLKVAGSIPAGPTFCTVLSLGWFHSSPHQTQSRALGLVAALIWL